MSGATWFQNDSSSTAKQASKRADNSSCIADSSKSRATIKITIVYRTPSLPRTNSSLQHTVILNALSFLPFKGPFNQKTMGVNFIICSVTWTSIQEDPWRGGLSMIRTVFWTSKAQFFTQYLIEDSPLFPVALQYKYSRHPGITAISPISALLFGQPLSFRWLFTASIEFRSIMPLIIKHVAKRWFRCGA